MESWDVIPDEDDTLLDDPYSWRRSQLATVGVIAAILLLAGLGVVLWNLLADEPDSLATVPTVSTTVVPSTLEPEPESTPPPTTLPLPGTTAPGTLPDLTPMTIPPTFPTLVPPSQVPPPATVIVTVTVPRTTPPVTASPATAPPPPATSSGTTPATVPATVPDTVTDTAPPADDSTIPPQTIPPPETVPPATVPPPSTPSGQRGNPQVLQDPQPSGLAYGDVQGAHGLAQQLADALALEQWGAGAALSPALSGSNDAALAAGYGGLDRASLILVDAVPEGDGYRLLIVSVANELGFSRTSLYCFEWTAQPGSGTVRQGGGIGRIAQVPGALSPDDVRADPGLDATVRNGCGWS